jgi:hypothetical protein
LLLYFKLVQTCPLISVCTQRQKEKEIYLLSSTNISEDKKAALENETAEMKVKICNCCVTVNDLKEQ